MQVTPTGKGALTGLTGTTLSSPGTASQGENVFRQMLAEINSQQRQADAQVRQSLLGEGELHEAMLALEKANLGLRVLVQVRNKLVSAYEELSRMSM